MKLLLDADIATLLPATDQEADNLLDESLKAHGCQNPLIAWKQSESVAVLVDGHRRFARCKALKIKYEVIFLEFENKATALHWVITYQLLRRNLTDERKAYFIGRMYLNRKQEHGGKREEVTDKPDTRPSGQNDHLTTKTEETVAAETGVSPKTVRRDADFAAAVDKIGEKDPEKKAEILSGQSGMTKTEVVEAAKPPAERKRTPPAPKPPAGSFDFKEQFEKPFGQVIRAVDSLGNAYQEKDCNMVAQLREDLNVFHRNFKQWYEQLLKAHPGPAPADPVVLTFPTVGKGMKEWDLTASKLAEFVESYPGVDALAECKKARQWCRDNEKKRKTPDGMAKFLGGWLGRVQNQGSNNGHVGESRNGVGSRLGRIEAPDGKYDGIGVTFGKAKA